MDFCSMKITRISESLLPVFTCEDYHNNKHQCCCIDHGIRLDCLRKACRYDQGKLNE